MALPIVTQLDTGVAYMQAYDLDFNGGANTDPCPLVHSMGTTLLIVTATITGTVDDGTMAIDLTDENTITVRTNASVTSPAGARIVIQKFPAA